MEEGASLAANNDTGTVEEASSVQLGGEGSSPLPATKTHAWLLLKAKDVVSMPYAVCSKRHTSILHQAVAGKGELRL